MFVAALLCAAERISHGGGRGRRPHHRLLAANTADRLRRDFAHLSARRAAGGNGSEPRTGLARGSTRARFPGIFCLSRRVFTLHIAKLEDALTFAAYFIIALTVGSLTAQFKAREHLAAQVQLAQEFRAPAQDAARLRFARTKDSARRDRGRQPGIVCG